MVASVCPAATFCPALTSTAVTRPDSAKDALAWLAGAMVPVAETVWVMVPRLTVSTCEEAAALAVPDRVPTHVPIPAPATTRTTAVTTTRRVVKSLRPRPIKASSPPGEAGDPAVRGPHQRSGTLECAQRFLRNSLERQQRQGSPLDRCRLFGRFALRRGGVLPVSSFSANGSPGGNRAPERAQAGSGASGGCPLGQDGLRQEGDFSTDWVKKETGSRRRLVQEGDWVKKERSGSAA